MSLRSLLGCAALGGVLAVASLAALGTLTASHNVPDVDDPLAAQPVSVAETKQDRAGPRPGARAAEVDPLLLAPQSMVGPGGRPLQFVALAAVEPAPRPEEMTASSRYGACRALAT